MARNRKIDYSTKVLQVKNLKKYFTVGTGKRKITVPAVDNVTFDVYKGEVFGLVGESGCGKTTTGRTIIKLYNPTDGDVILNNERITAGLKGFQDQIEEAKKELKIQKIKLNPLKNEIYELTEEKNTSISELKKKLTKLEEQYKNDYEAANAKVLEYNNEVFTLSNIYNLNLADAKYDYIVASKKISKTELQKAKEEHKIKLKTENIRFNRKVAGINESLALSPEARASQIVDLKTVHAQNLEILEKEWNDKLALINQNPENQDLRKEQIEKFKLEYANKVTNLKNTYQSNLEAIKKPNYDEVKTKREELLNQYKLDKEAINNQINLVKSNYATSKAKIVLNAKNNPDKYTVNQEQIEQAKLTFLEKKTALKVEIEKAKADNKVKRTSTIASKMQMIFQDPISSLNPRMTVKEIISEGLVIQNQSTKEEIDEKVKEALELVGLAPEYASRYPHEFSGGQRQRIGIARALVINPDVLIADEPISALDVSIQAQVINLLESLKEKLGLTIVFIAHDLSVVKYFCDRIAVMYMGKIVEIASSDEIFNNPLHPYTKSLLSAIPQPDPDFEKNRKRIKYNPGIHNYSVDKPTMVEITPGHSVYLNTEEITKLKKGEL